MTGWVALLRGINVGRAKRISMADLRTILVSLDLDAVRTVQVSGNVVFRARWGDEQMLGKKIAARIKAETGFDTVALVRSGDDLARVIDANPFPRRGVDPKQLHVVFLSAQPRKELIAGVDRADVAPDEFEVGERVIYVRLPAGVMASNMPDWEKALGLSATMRTWGTVLRLSAAVGDAG